MYGSRFDTTNSEGRLEIPGGMTRGKAMLLPALGYAAMDEPACLVSRVGVRPDRRDPDRRAVRTAAPPARHRIPRLRDRQWAVRCRSHHEADGGGTGSRQRHRYRAD